MAHEEVGILGRHPSTQCSSHKVFVADCTIFIGEDEIDDFSNVWDGYLSFVHCLVNILRQAVMLSL